MNLLILISIIVSNSVAETVHVDASGKVYVSPETRAKEQDGMRLLQTAGELFAKQPQDRLACIESLETVLREVELDPRVREDILLKLARLYGKEAVYPSITAATNLTLAIAREAHLRRELHCYTTVRSRCQDSERPVLVGEILLRVGDVYLNLGEKRNALEHYLSSRSIVLDTSYPTETTGSARRRTSIAEEALSRILNVYAQPFRQHFRAQILLNAEDDPVLRNALNSISKPDATAVSPPASHGCLRVSLFLASSVLTVCAVVIMRRGTIRPPRSASSLVADLTVVQNREEQVT